VFNIFMSGFEYFAPLISMTFKLPYQIFPTSNQAMLQLLERTYNLCNACNLNGGEWDDLQGGEWDFVN
jgi:hypothetical protein